MRKGFTIAELTIATAISAIVAVTTFNLFLGSQRLLKLTLARSELSLQARAMRDRMLFHAEPELGTSSTGLLSAPDVTISGSGNSSKLNASLVRFTSNGTGTADEDVQLDAGQKRLFEVAFHAPGTSLTVSNRFFVNLSGSVTVGGLVVRHDERVSVPLFGREQPADPQMGGGL